MQPGCDLLQKKRLRTSSSNKTENFMQHINGWKVKTVCVFLSFSYFFVLNWKYFSMRLIFLFAVQEKVKEKTILFQLFVYFFKKIFAPIRA